MAIHGRLLARLVPKQDGSSSRKMKKPIHAEMDPCTLQDGTGPRSWLAMFASRKEVFSMSHPPSKSNDSVIENSKKYEDQSESFDTSLEVYLWPHINGKGTLTDPPIVLNLNRDSSELLNQTLKRMEINLQKKLNMGKNGKNNGRKPNGKDSIKRTAGSSIAPSSRICCVDSITLQSIQELETSEFTNAQMWNLAKHMPLVVEITAPSDQGIVEDNQIDETLIYRLLVEPNPPTLTSVRTFEDFSASVFVDVPLVVEADVLSTHNSACRVDWYVDGKLRCSNCTTYTPTHGDLDKIVSVLLTPYLNSDEKGEEAPRGQSFCLEEAYFFQQPVEPLPENTLLRLRREWLSNHLRIPEPQADNPLLRIVTYNILADQNAFQSNQMPFYPYVPKEILLKSRRMPLIIQELLAYRTDVMCLQEVDEAVFETLLQPVFGHPLLGNYDGYYACKSNEGTREGLALFLRRDRFEAVSEKDRKLFQLNDLVTKYLIGNDPEAGEDSATFSDLLARHDELRTCLTLRLGHVVQMLPLIDKFTGTQIWIVNTHLFFHPFASHVRLLQIYAISRQLITEQQRNKNNVENDEGRSLIFCGDLNSSLHNAAGKLLVDRYVPTNFRDLKTHLNRFRWEVEGDEGHVLQEETTEYTTSSRPEKEEDFLSMSLPEAFPHVQSAMLVEPPFSHYIPHFSATLDHILVSNASEHSDNEGHQKHVALIPVSSAPMPDFQHVPDFMPSANLPSDHVSLVCDLKIINKQR